MSDRSKLKPAIARIWRGRVAPETADEYQAYLIETGIRPLHETALRVELFREDRETDTEFVTISYWETEEAMTRFAGSNARRIHHLPKDADYLLEVPKGVQILHIVETGL